ncbi:hypothetical protein AKO1_010973 [Acrasis kona]|uniref:Phosphatidate phosphatase APP1 catalytic domain-containing protein n=1 Tax=Acrasis kona TaxID=1008807 RepID=A0AAW2YR53_9EUKA
MPIRRAANLFKIATLFSSSIVTILFVLAVVHFLNFGRDTFKFQSSLTLHRTVAYIHNQKLHVPIHGLVYETHHKLTWLEVKHWWRQVISALVLYLTSFLKTDEEHFVHVQALLMQFGRQGVPVSIQLGNVRHNLTTDQDGFFYDDIVVENPQVGKDGWLNYQVYFENETIQGYAQVIDDTPNKISIVSDIDDTIKLTNVTHMMTMMQNTFKSFTAIPDMAKIYQSWGDKAYFHYVSSSPYQLYPKLEDFLEREGFPMGSFHLRYVSFITNSFFNIFRSSKKTKPFIIKRLLRQHPNRKFVLIGDSNEADPSIYASVYRDFPDQVKYIFIRCDQHCGEERWQRDFMAVPSTIWKYFYDPKDLLNVNIFE